VTPFCEVPVTVEVGPSMWACVGATVVCVVSTVVGIVVVMTVGVGGLSLPPPSSLPPSS
jgi:hypothetical protein